MFMDIVRAFEEMLNDFGFAMSVLCFTNANQVNRTL